MTAQRLKMLLAAQGMRPSEFARRLGVERAAVNNWFSRGIPPARLLEAASVLGLTVDQIRPYCSDPSENTAEIATQREIEAFLTRLRHPPLEARLAVLEKLFSLAEE